MKILILLSIPACMVGEDEATHGTDGSSIGQTEARLKGCKGQASSTVPASGVYTITTFGGPGDHQSMSCGGFADGTTWYAASRQRYGCGAKLKIEANGKCAVVAALDYGPDVCVENAAGAPIIDVSPLVGKELFGESALGYSDNKSVTVTEVPASTPLGRCVAGAPTPDEPPPTTSATCFSATLDRDVEAGTCVQGASDARWYECEGGAWISRAGKTGCSEAYGWCYSATLGESVAPRTCVQAASNGVWYQCNGQQWVSPVSTSSQTGPLGECAGWNAL